MDSTFSINLPGVIDLLGRRLHDHPSFFIRDLVRLAADSIRARESLEPDYSGSITIEVLGGQTPVLAFLDDGAGLTEEELRDRLATVGQAELGILSCFAVSDEVVVISKSARSETHPVVEWRGRVDGSYSIRAIDREMCPGTQIYLSCKPGCEEVFAFDLVTDLARDFASCLPCPMRVVRGDDSVVINGSEPPWRRRFTSTEQQTRELLEFGRESFDLEFLDVIPLKSKAGGIDGVAYILPYLSAPADLRNHLVYQGEMLVTEQVDWLLPDWADFVLCAISVGCLPTTTTGEEILWSEELRLAKDTIEGCLRDYLVGLASRDPGKLSWLISLHGDSIKTLALRDDEFYRLAIDWLVFETSLGEMTIGEYRERFGAVLFVEFEYEFRQIAPFASSRGTCVVLADSTLDIELLNRLPVLVPEAECQEVSLKDWGPTRKEPDQPESAGLPALLAVAEGVLRPYSCCVEAVAAPSDDPPAIYCLPSLLGDFSDEEPEEDEEPDESQDFAVDEQTGPLARLLLNSHHPLIRELAEGQDRGFQGRSVEILYLQALLSGGHPLGIREMGIVNQGLIGLLQRSQPKK